MNVVLEREFWNQASLAGESRARRAVWDEDLYEIGVVDCLDELGDLMPTLERGGRVLDLGCGVGRLTIPLASAYPTAQLVGVDLSVGMLQIARAAARRTGVKARFLRGDGRALPKIGRIDGAFCVLLFQHIPRDATLSYIDQIGFRLPPGGVFRFQFARTSDDAFLTHGLEESAVCEWCDQVGMTVESVTRGAVMECWTWVTAVRR